MFLRTNSWSAAGWCLAAMLLSISSSAPRAAKPEVLVRIADVEGVAIGGASILLHSDPAGELKPIVRPDVVLRSDASGSAAAAPGAGFYDVIAMASGFSPMCRKILVENGHQQRLVFHLQTDPLVTHYLGDRFPH